MTIKQQRRRRNFPELKPARPPMPAPIIQPAMSEAIGKLSKFSDQEGIAAIIMTLNNFEIMGDIEDGAVDNLWGKLQTIRNNLANAGIIRDNLPFIEAAYYAQLALVELKPEKDACFVTLCEIDEKNRVVVSSGEDFDIEQLAEYHNRRDYRGTALGESHNSKWLLNPKTHHRFSVRDVQQLKAFAASKNNPDLVFKDLREETITSTPLPYSGTASNILALLNQVPNLEADLEQKVGPGLTSNESKSSSQDEVKLLPTVLEGFSLSSLGELRPIGSYHHREIKEREIKIPELKIIGSGLFNSSQDRRRGSRQPERMFGSGRGRISFIRLDTPSPTLLLNTESLFSWDDIKQTTTTPTPPYVITPEQKAQLGPIKTMFIQPRGLQALSEGLINIDQMIAMHVDKVTFLLGTGGDVLNALRTGIISMTQINNLHHDKARVLRDVASVVISALRDNLITIAQINAIENLKLLQLFCDTGNGIMALKEGLINIEQVKAMPYHILEQVVKINCLNALREERVTIQQIMEMDYLELWDRVSDNNFPSTTPTP